MQKNYAAAGKDVISWNSLVDALVLITIFSVLLLDFNGYRWLMPIDEGQWLFYADQLLQGKVLYREIWYQFGPMVLFGLKWSMQILGKTLATERIYFWFLSLIGLAALYLFSKQLLERRTIKLLLCLIALLNSLTCKLMMVNPAFLARQCFGLLPLYLLFGSSSEKGRWKYFAAGFLSMFSILVSQETGTFSLVASLTFLAMKRFESRRNALCLKELSWFAAAFLLCLLMWMSYCLHEGFVKDYFVISFGEIFSMVGKYQHSPLPVLSSLIENYRNLAAYYHMALTYLPILVSLLTITYVAASKKLDARLVSISVYGICCFGILLGRCDIYHSTFAGLPLLILISYWFERALCVKGRTAQYSMISVITGFCLLLLTANASNLSKLFANSRIVKKTAYAEKLSYLGSAMIPMDQYEAIWSAKGVIEHNSHASQEFIIILNSPFYYFFIDRPTSTRFATPLFANNEEAKREILQELREGTYYFVLYDNIRFPAVDYDYYFREIFDVVRAGYSTFSKTGDHTFVLKIRNRSR